jgi:hypothetical protein
MVLLLSLVMFLRLDTVTVRLPREENRLFKAVRVVSGSEVVLSYRHSVEKSMVEGVFVVGSGPELQAKQTRMASVGTGLPNTRLESTRRDGKWIVVDEGLTAIPGFDFFISAINDVRMSVDGTDIAVHQLDSGSVIHVDVEQVRLLAWILWRYADKDWRKDRQP